MYVCMCICTGTYTNINQTNELRRQDNHFVMTADEQGEVRVHNLKAATTPSFSTLCCYQM